MSAPANSGNSRGEARKAKEAELLARLDTARLDSDEKAARNARDELVELHLGLVHHLAGRHSGPGQEHDDLFQAGCIGLMRAIDDWSADGGASLATYATHAINGEIRRQLLERSWTLRAPRRVRENAVKIASAQARLQDDGTQALTVEALERATGLDTEEILEALEARQVAVAGSINDSEGEEQAGLLGSVEVAYEQVEDRIVIEELLEELDTREKEIVFKRFVEEKSQSQIAEEVGISQMHVSRLLTKSLARMREKAQEQ